MNAVATSIFLLVGLVNALPLVGVTSNARLASLYGVVIDEPNLSILMRHRAVLFAIVGGLLVCSAFSPALRPAAVVAGLLSMLSFVVLALLVGGYNASIGRLVVIDVVASVALVVGFLLNQWAQRGSPPA